MRDIMRVENMRNNKGNTVKNQFIIIHALPGRKIVAFQSYNAIIAQKVYENGLTVYLDTNYWDYSVTTGKYRNIFLNETKKETEKKIAGGEYILTNLN